MPNLNSPVNNLLLGLGYAQLANAERERASVDASIQRQRATNAERQLMDAEFKSKRVTTDADLKRQRDAAAFESNVLRERLAGVQKNAAEVSAKFQEQLAEKDALILEWMHSNEAFKQLARQYSKKAGVTDEQRQEDFDNTLVDIAEEDPRFANTEKGARAKDRLKVKGK